MDKKGNKRMAVLVGCNYPNTPNELHGCINDVIAMREMLVNRFGFDPNHIQMLTDESGSVKMKPTGANIKKALAEMVDNSQSGDVLFFHYSGHGTSIPSLKPIHPFRHDEAIVPTDFNLITGKLFYSFPHFLTLELNLIGSLKQGQILRGHDSLLTPKV